METYEITPEETLLLEPGEYFVSLAFVGCSEKSRKEWEEQSSWTGKKYMEAIIRNELLFPPVFQVQLHQEHGDGRHIPVRAEYGAFRHRYRV